MCIDKLRENVSQENATARERQSPIVSLTQMKRAVVFRADAVRNTRSHQRCAVHLHSVYNDGDFRLATNCVSDRQKNRVYPAVLYSGRKGNRPLQC